MNFMYFDLKCATPRGTFIIYLFIDLNFHYYNAGGFAVDVVAR